MHGKGHSAEFARNVIGVLERLTDSPGTVVAGPDDLCARCPALKDGICMGNVEQIDTPYLTETTSGLTYAVDRFKNWAHSAHVTLRRGERSRLADYASEVL